MADPDAEFWIVFGLFEQRPSHRPYDTATDAKEAARQLARRNPGVYYFVMKTTDVFYQDPAAVVGKVPKPRKNSAP